MKPLKCALCLSVFLFLPSLASADTIIMKNGNQYKGAVLKETREEVEAMIDVGVLRFRRADVATIQKGSIWENNFYLKKAEEYFKAAKATEGAVKTPAPKKIASTAAHPAARPTEAKAKPAGALAADTTFRERELELRKQEMEIKRMELELQKEELKFKRDALEAGKEEHLSSQGKGAAEVIEKKESVEKEETPAVEEGAETGEAVPAKKPLSEEEIRQITIEEQQKEQARKEKLESERRLQEIRQREEGVTIRGKVAPASGEKYNTY